MGGKEGENPSSIFPPPVGDGTICFLCFGEYFRINPRKAPGIGGGNYAEPAINPFNLFHRKRGKSFSLSGSGVFGVNLVKFVRIKMQSDLPGTLFQTKSVNLGNQ